MNPKVKVAIALGSNLGDREQIIRLAAKKLEENFLEEAKLSKVIETEPWGIKEQPRFLNAVTVGFSEWSPSAILDSLKSLERDLGRTQTVRNGPRIIDLDLICYGDLIVRSEKLEVPHPRMTERDFVLVPLLEVWSEWVHPVLNKNVSSLLADLQAIKPV